MYKVTISEKPIAQTLNNFRSSLAELHEKNDQRKKNLDKSTIQFSLKISWAFQWCTLFINFYLLGKRRYMQRSKIKFF